MSTDKFLFLCRNKESKILGDSNDPIGNRYTFTDEDKNFETGANNLCQHYQGALSELEASADDLDSLVKPTLSFYLDVQKLADFTREILTPNDYTDDGSPWRILEISLEEALPDLKKYLFEYVKWSYSKTSSNPQIKSNPESNRPGDPSYMQSSASIKDRFNKRFNQEQNIKGSGRGQQRNQKFDRNSHPNSNNNNSNSNKRPGKRNPRHSGGRNQDQRSREEKNEFYQKKAMDEAKRAIDTMKGDSSIDKMPLKPVNSFIRRMQHQLISDSQLFSKSQGEGRDRCIVVLREENNKDTSS